MLAHVTIIKINLFLREMYLAKCQEHSTNVFKSKGLHFSDWGKLLSKQLQSRPRQHCE